MRDTQDVPGVGKAATAGTGPVAWGLRNSLLIGLLGAAFGAAFCPGPGIFLRSHGVIPVVIVVVFFLQGLTARLDHLLDRLRDVRLMSCGLLLSCGIAPLIGWTAASLTGWSGDAFVGIVLAVAVPPTLVSGIVISRMAGGSFSGAVVLTILLNAIGVVLLPFTLAIELSTTVEIAVLPLLLKMTILMIVPAVIGMIVRRRAKPAVERHPELFRQLPVFLFFLVVYVPMSTEVDTLSNMGMRRLGEIGIVCTAAHLTLFLVAYVVGRAARLDTQSVRSLCFVCAQRTITVSTAVWATQFSQAFPKALVVCIALHIVQLFIDGVLARIWAARSPVPNEP